MIDDRKRASLPYTLIVLRGISAYYLMRLHLYTEMLSDKVDSRQNGQERIPLAASWAANIRDSAK